MPKHIKKKKNSGAMGAITSCISTTLVLILLGIVMFFVTMGNNLGRSLRENFTVQVLLSDSLRPYQAQALASRLYRQPFTLSMSYSSKEKATREQAEALGTDPAEFLDVSPIPASFEIHLKAAYTHRDSLSRYIPYIRQQSGVTDVIYPQDLMESVNHNIRQISFILLGVAILLVFVSFSLINNVMRMSVYAHRFTIHTMKLVGARWRVIRRPFLWRALSIGAISAVLADGVLYGCIMSMLQWEPNLSALITFEVWVATLGTVVVFGLLLTSLCALISVNKFLRMNTSRLILA